MTERSNFGTGGLTMDVREKLAEIVKKAAYSSLPSNTEDFHLNMFVTNLLSHGVTVQEWVSAVESASSG